MTAPLRFSIPFRPWPSVAFRAGCILATALLPLPAIGAAAEPAPPVAPSIPASVDAKLPLPVRDVVLFSSGVGYFQHAGEISGAATINFSFRTEQINDLLKSLVLFDPSGAVQPVTYAASDPIARGLGGLGIDLAGSNSMAALLRQLQGARVRITTPAGDVEGQVVSVNAQTITTKDGTVSIDILNLLTDGGLVSYPLPDVKQVKLLDPALDKKLRDALALLATGLDKQRKSVSIRFGDGGRREVRMGYLLESPVWKTSYRLVLDEKKAPYLQGWSIVENTTDQDWNSVHLSLVSGRPVSFVEDLYTPLYVPRPVVQPQIIGSATPQLYAGGLEAKDEPTALKSESELAQNAAAAMPLGAAAAPPGAGGFGGGRDVGALAFARRRELSDTVDRLATSVSSAAQGAERGELFEYALKDPITIPSHQAAMVPIVTNTIGGEKLSIYTPEVNSDHPMNAVRLKNTTGLHLSGGPITVFDDGIYAGDAQIDTLQPGEDRLLSYAVDLAVDGKSETANGPEQILTARADAGVLYLTRKMRVVHKYTLHNKDSKPRKVVIEQPIEERWTLVDPKKPDEKTADHYRFNVDVPAGKTGIFQDAVEQPQTESITLIDADLNYLTTYVKNAKLSDSLRSALAELVARRRKITDLQAQRAASEAEIATITQEQTRIRDNMRELDRNSDLYKQYVRKLTAQESRIEEVRANIERLRDAEKAAQDSLRQYLDTLKIQG